MSGVCLKSFIEEVFTISCSSFFYELFLHYSFPKLSSARNLHFSFLHGTPMSIFKLCHHSSSQDLALYMLQLKQCYSFASALSFSGFLCDFSALVNKPISCLIQCHPLAGCIVMAFYVSAPTFKSIQFFYFSSLMSLLVPSFILSPSLSTTVHAPALSSNDLFSASSLHSLSLFKTVIFLHTLFLLLSLFFNHLQASF